MIKVIRHGIRKVTCPYCKAKLEYEQEDVRIGEEHIETFPGEWEDEDYEYIVCPDCNEEIVIFRG